MHLRGCSREDEDAVFAAEDAKRPRAGSPANGAAALPVVCTGSRAARPLDESSSIYKLTSPWLTVPAPKESQARVSMEEGGRARALCFDGEGEEAEDHQQVRLETVERLGIEERGAWFRVNLFSKLARRERGRAESSLDHPEGFWFAL